MISLLYITEIILGFNGKLMMIRNLPIRWILFCLVFFMSSIKFPHKFQKNMFDSLDYALALFLLFNLIWIFIVPYYSGYSIKMAIKEVLSFSTLLLYFPLTILISSQKINWPKYKIVVKYCLFVLASTHIVLYISEKITLGNSQRPLVMMPYFCVRIIYPCSIFFILMFYFVIESSFSRKNILYYIIALTALYTPLTKSLWLGVGCGMIFFLVYYVLTFRRKSSLIAFKKIIMVLAVPLNQPMSSAAVMNLDKTISKSEEELYGTQRANYTRIEQTKELLTKWKKRPLIGFGYGSYIPDYLRSAKSTPYSYEMFFPALLMKIGILRILGWAIFIFYLFKYSISKLGLKNKNTFSILYIIVALGIATQFNPYLFNSSGMSIVLFCLIELKYQIACKNTETFTNQPVDIH